MKNKILVTGGAGYIGSITVQELIKAGYDVVVFDNLVHGHKEAIKDVELIQADLLDKKSVNNVFSDHKFEGVVHFAAYTLAGESMENPAKYFENNIMGGTNLLEAMRKHEVKNFVFSSTCAVYGFPENLPVTENESHKPVSVYGQSKDMFESVLDWYDELFGIKHVKLRYFNACGAALDGSIGEAHSPESHIIPIAIEAALGKRDKFTIFGDDYKTDDGTCVRDYIHILDLASAHIKALEYLKANDKSNDFNLGTGNGYSNKQILDTIKEVSGSDFKVEIGPRREGDPDAIFADNTKAVNILGWEPKYSDLDTIIKSAYKWHSTHLSSRT
jgi:UDP-glucose 4-epimerase